MSAVTRSSQVLAISTTSAQFTNAMTVGQKYVLISTTACWYKISATGGTAAAAANSVYLPADTPYEIKAPDATNGFVQVVAVSGTGTANLTLLEQA